MDTLLDILTPLEPWHWIALGLVLIGIELAVGTFDLLWIGTAALATSVFSAILPEAQVGVGPQFAFFAVTAIALLILGRTVFGGWRDAKSDAPLLNKRMETLIGTRALVIRTFEAGTGKVKIGDTEWLAHAVDGEDFAEGATVMVKDVESTVVKVAAA